MHTHVCRYRFYQLDDVSIYIYIDPIKWRKDSVMFKSWQKYKHTYMYLTIQGVHINKYNCLYVFVNRSESESLTHSIKTYKRQMTVWNFNTLAIFATNCVLS